MEAETQLKVMDKIYKTIKKILPLVIWCAGSFSKLKMHKLMNKTISWFYSNVSQNINYFIIILFRSLEFPKSAKQLEKYNSKADLTNTAERSTSNLIKRSKQLTVKYRRENGRQYWIREANQLTTLNKANRETSSSKASLSSLKH